MIKHDTMQNKMLTYSIVTLPVVLAKAIVGLFLISSLLSSCQEIQTPSDDILIARVYDHHLYRSDVAGVVPSGTTFQDSSLTVRRYIDSWVRQHVFLHHAMTTLDPEQMDFEKKIQGYKNSLIVFTFETELVKQYLDTLIDEYQIAAYYEVHQNDFKLQDHIVKVIYVKVPRDTPEIWRLRNLYRTTDDDELSLLEEFCVQHAASYLIDGDTWLLFRDLMREIPISTNNIESYLRSNKYVELSDSYYRYFLHIQDYRLRGSISPLALERDNVRSLILNQRKHEFVNQRRDQYIQQAIHDGQMEIFY